MYKGTGKLKAYQKDLDYSYAPGAYAAYEMINSAASFARAAVIHSGYKDKAALEKACLSRQVPFFYDDRCFDRLKFKENCYVFGVFDKFSLDLSPFRPHIVLVNPSDMGNIGTIIRTMAGFNFLDLAIVTPAADTFNPKTVRASMGAIFSVNIKHFDSINAYLTAYPGHHPYPFMINGKTLLTAENCPEPGLFALIFGNEAAGLGAEFDDIGESVTIPQSGLVDSLNISVAASVGMFLFSLKNSLL